MKISHLLYAALFFFVLPFLAYQVASFYTDQYFRAKCIPFPSETFALLAGLGSCFWILGTSFFIHSTTFKWWSHGSLFKKKGNKP